MSFNPSVVRLTASPIPIWGGSPGVSLLIYNPDTANTVYIGNNNTISVGASNASPLGPLQSVSVDGSNVVYGCAPTGTEGTVIIPGGSSFSPGSLAISGPVTAEITGPVAVSSIESQVTVSSISAPIDIGTISGPVTVTGTTDVQVQNANIDVVGGGGYIAPGQLVSIYAQAFSLTAGASITMPLTSAMSFASIDITMDAVAGTSTATGAAITLSCQATFFDPNGITCKVIPFNCIIPGGGATQSTAVSLPCYGTNVTVSATNPGSVGTVTGTMSVCGSYRVLSQPAYAFGAGNMTSPWTAGGITWMPLQSLAAGWISVGSTTGPASGVTYAYLFNPYFGPVFGQFTISTAAAGADPTIVDLGVGATYGSVVAGAAYLGQIINMSNYTAAPGATTNLDLVALPLSPCALLVKGGTSAAGLGWQIQGVNL